MKLLLISDEEDGFLWDHYRPGCLAGYDLILSAGDLKSDYLTFLVTMANRPLLYVHGNHDECYELSPPEGCECIDDRLVTVGGLRILGLGGSQRYREGPYQYSEREMARRIRKLKRKIRKAGGVDIVLARFAAMGIWRILSTGALRPSYPCLTSGSRAISSTDMSISVTARSSPAFNSMVRRRSSTPVGSTRWKYDRILNHAQASSDACACYFSVTLS